LNELQRGRCLLLLDGLDEVASDELRRRVAENISTFVAQHSPENGNARDFNRFIITSRIVGYEAGTYANYAHYTLQDLEDKQIEQFLANWCPAVERHQKTFAQGMRKLTLAETEQANKVGREQKTKLWEALQNNPGIKRLAVNPLMLTILALIQRSGKTLPHRRIELYQIVTRTLLDNWNHESGRRVFPVEEIPLAEQLLASLGYEMHSTDRLLTEAKVKEIAGRAMQVFYGQAQKEQTIKNFIDTLRSSSGLFIETGQGFFSFMHRTFQEYFAAQQLLRLPWSELQDFVRSHAHIALWQEPLLLLTAYKSTPSSREEQKQASDLIRIIVDSSDEYDAILQRNLLLAANCVVDCSAWSVEHTLQHTIATRIFEIYGDSVGIGRYSVLQKDIEKLALTWLRGQPVESNDTIG
jgi:predicted NACHT family NTPase